ncbi:MAG: cupredoxin domain-containing protein [Actinomycetota bacterium]|nr:cupredoxin domain-containing protein [Actinomycetota bacterium]
MDAAHYNALSRTGRARLYRWWVFLHVAGVFGFLIAHGVSVMVTFRLRRERDPTKVAGLLELSGSSIRAFYWSLGVLLVSGTVAGFLGHWWGRAWIWAAIAVLVLTSLAMYAMARPYYRRVGLVARAMAGGSHAVSEDQLVSILRSRRPLSIAGIGFVGLAAILYFMMLKPSFGFSTAAPPVVLPSGSNAVAVTAVNTTFTTDHLDVPASKAFDIMFDNEDLGIPHNVAIYTDSSATDALFVGQTFNGTATRTYHVPALPAGTYFFRCDVHPQMNGTLSVG